MMRKKIVAGNWKMNKTPKEALELIEILKPLVGGQDKVEVVFCPPAVDLVIAAEAVKGTNIKIGAQNMYCEESGAYTGEISPAMVKESGCEYVILGHSERRGYFGETDELINLKVKKAFEHGLTPIICVGEKLSEREQGITLDLIRMQVKIALKDIDPENVKKTVIAYEPIWAIGTGKTATSVQAEEVCCAIRECVKEVFGQEVSDEIRIQYGGSVNAGNAAELFAMPNIDGGLVGGASLKADFAKIVNY
ncbi:MAG: triose-phosphate isomerase [Firmicutes bacterium]|nr:triose-phosphate isomerase [Bacillota bacterium]